MIKEFVKQDIINERSLGYNAGDVYRLNNRKPIKKEIKQ